MKNRNKKDGPESNQADVIRRISREVFRHMPKEKSIPSKKIYNRKKSRSKKIQPLLDPSLKAGVK